MSRGDGDFLARWSSRKLKARETPEAEVPPADPALAATPAPDVSEKTDEEILQELGLPDPDTMVSGDDFSAFLKSAVPARLRNRALRRLWRSNPVLANLDGLNDYEGDFTDAATVVKGGLKTAYQIGRGFLRDDEETLAAAERSPRERPVAGSPEDDPAAAAPDDAPAEDGTTNEAAARDATDDPAGDAAGRAEAEAGAAEASAGEAPAADGRMADGRTGGPAPDGAEGTPPRPARMRFRFERG